MLAPVRYGVPPQCHIFYKYSIMRNKAECHDGVYIFCCPQCDMFIVVMQSEINCKIFRHAAYKAAGQTSTAIVGQAAGQPIDPHMAQDKCEQ